MPPNPEGRTLALDFLAVRKAVGLVGAALPVALLLGGLLLFGVFEPSISEYHGSGMRDVFVGLLCAVGVFLVAHRGHGAQDWYASQVAGAAALLVAVFPSTGRTSTAHFAAAAVFFVTLALTSLLLFTRSSKGKEDQPRGKRRRNGAYVVCGWGILACVGLIVLYDLALKGRSARLDALAPVFWLEAFAIWFFAASWLIKGEAMMGGLRRFFMAGEE